VVTARDGRPVRRLLVDAGRDEQGSDPDQQRDDDQGRDRRGELERRFAFGVGASCSLVWVAMSAAAGGEGYCPQELFLTPTTGAAQRIASTASAVTGAVFGGDDGFHRGAPSG
jgi:hypothetical protein